jgi:hypothetical protein
MDVMKELQGLLGKHFDTRDPDASKLPIFLPSNTCPSGFVACDPNGGGCPSDEDGLTPPIYTQDGLRCHTKIGVHKARLSEGDADVVVRGVRGLVGQLATLRDVNIELDKALEKETPTPPQKLQGGNEPDEFNCKHFGVE